MSNIFLKRLTKELRDLQTNPPAGVVVEKAEEDLKLWRIIVYGAAGTLYEGETFVLQ
ncbi:ubiquitin-conjugating enzyme E2 W, partial [Blyttiomyces sp. JEL0837]